MQIEDVLLILSRLDTKSALCLNSLINIMYLNPRFLYYLSGGEEKLILQYLCSVFTSVYL